LSPRERKRGEKRCIFDQRHVFPCGRRFPINQAGSGDGGPAVLADVFRYRGAAARATAVVLSVVQPAAAWPVTQQDVAVCVNRGNAYPPDMRIAGCSAVIESGNWSGHELIWAYVNRGLAHAAKGDPRAIADFSEAIKIEPQQLR